VPASYSIIYPDDVTLVQASTEEPVRVSVGGDTLRYGTSSASLSSTLTAGQSATLTASNYVKTDGNGAVLLRTYNAWEAPAAANTAYVTKATADSKGDLFAASADDTVARLAAGSNGQVLTAASGETLGVRWQSPGAFNVVDYGAVGGQNCTTAFQDAFTAACAVNGTVLIPAPANGSAYLLTDTITVQPAGAGSQVRCNVIASGYWDSIEWQGANSKSIFRTLGLKHSLWSGVKLLIRAPSSVVGFDLDIDGTRASSGNDTFVGCEVSAVGAATNCDAFRIANNPSGSGNESSVISFINCLASFEAASTGNVAFRNVSPNSTAHQWFGCGSSGCDKFFTTLNNAGSTSGGSGCFFYGTTTSLTETVDFDLQTAGAYVIVGGRTELGKQFLTTGASAGRNVPNIYVAGLNISDYQPPSNILFNLFGACHVTVENVHFNQSGGAYVPYTAAMFTCSTHATQGFASLQLRNCSIQGVDPPVTVAQGQWDVEVKGCALIQTDGQTTARIGGTASVASAATVTLPVHVDTITITGTTNITSVTAGVPGRRVTLLFADVLTFTDGSNLKLAGNFTTSADDSITLVSDGTNWIEVARSAN
jgi:hypothetical protein